MGVEELAGQLMVLAALAGDCDLVPSTHTGMLTNTFQFQEIQHPPLVPLRHLHSRGVYKLTQARVYTPTNVVLLGVCLEIQHLWKVTPSHLPPPEDPNCGLGQLGDEACWLFVQGHCCSGGRRIVSTSAWMLSHSPPWAMLEARLAHVA